MKIKSEKLVYFVLFLISLSLVFVFIFKILIPIKNDSYLIRGEYFKKVDIYNRLNNTKVNVQKIFENYLKEDDIYMTELALPDDPKIYEIIILIKEIAELSKVDVENFTFNDSYNFEIGVVKVGFDVKGKYENITDDFLKEINTELRIMNIEFVKLEKEGSLVKGQVWLNTYFKN